MRYERCQPRQGVTDTRSERLSVTSSKRSDPDWTRVPGARPGPGRLRRCAVHRHSPGCPAGTQEKAPPMILVDTGSLVALFDRKDAQHQRCVRALKVVREPIRTTVPVLTEAFHMLGPGSVGSDRLREF